MQPEQQPNKSPSEAQVSQSISPVPSFQASTPPPNNFGGSPTPGTASQTQSGKTNGLAIAGLVLAFLIPLVGLILSIVGLNQIKKRGDKGEGLAIAGIVLSIINMIVSIGIMAALTMATFSGVQQKARDTERQTDINQLHTQLESFYNENDYYPAKLTELKNLDPVALSPSGGTASDYKYQPVPTGCTKCKSYTLSTNLENGTSYTKKSLY